MNSSNVAVDGLPAQLINSHSTSNLFYSSRPLYNTKEFEEIYKSKKLKSENVFKTAAHYCFKYYKPSGGCLKSYVKERLPCLKWMLGYNFKENTLPDLISGLTIGIVHIPQGRL